LPGLEFFGKEYYMAKQISPISLIMGTTPGNIRRKLGAQYCQNKYHL
jgi:hypothetical protein